MAGRRINNGSVSPDLSDLEVEPELGHEISEPLELNANVSSSDTRTDSDPSDPIIPKWKRTKSKCLRIRNVTDQSGDIDQKPLNKRRWRCSINRKKKRDAVENTQKIEEITRRLRELEERSFKITMLKFRIDYLIAQYTQQQQEDEDSNPDEE